VLSTRGALIAVLTVAGLLASCSSKSTESSRTTTTRSATTTTVALTYTAHVVGEVEVDPAYRQGLARVDAGWIFSVNDGLFITDDALHQTTKLVPAIPAEWKARGFNHIGDVDVAKGVLYAPLEQPDYERGQQAMLTYDAATLKYTGGLNVAQHENSFVTVDPTTGVAYSMDRFGGDALLRYDVGDGWRPLAPLKLSTLIDRVQGADIRDGAVWLSTDDATDGVYRVDLATGKVAALGSIGHVDGEGEGIDASPSSKGDLHVLSIDVKVVPVRLIELRVDGTPVSR
jgi:hypothetical protein